MTAIFLASHNDDAELFGCFSILAHRPKVIVCLRSEREAGLGYPGGPVFAKTREEETARAMALLGVDWEQWTFTDDRAPDEAALLDAMTSLDQTSEYVERVFAPAPELEGGHPDHDLIGMLALQVFDERVTRYPTYTTTKGRSTWGTEVVPEPWMIPLKLRALACYESQIGLPSCRPWFMGALNEYVA